MTTETQSSLILKHLQDGKTITALEALQLFGCLRLGARCWDLRKAGHQIESKMVVTNSGKHVAQYRLAQ